MKKERIKLIYGIGNEEKNYKNTVHNLGKEIIKFYLQKPNNLKFSFYEKQNNLILATNSNYVNNCGLGIKELSEKFKLKPENILVIHDDADIVFPLFKISFGANSAGHKGIESIIKNLKTKNFWRLRIGIQGKTRERAEDIVLKKWSKKENKIIEKIKRKFKIILDKFAEGKLPNELNLEKKYFLK